MLALHLKYCFCAQTAVEELTLSYNIRVCTVYEDVSESVLAESDRVAREADGLILGHLDELESSAPNALLRGSREGTREPDGEALRYRAEARVQVVEARVTQLHFDELEVWPSGAQVLRRIRVERPVGQRA